MTTRIQHFSHPEHTLELKDEVVSKQKVSPMCYGCNKPIITASSSSNAAYTCTSCDNFFLHKRCAELPIQVKHPMHNKHSLTLLPRLSNRSFCDVCKRKLEHFGYRCDVCDYDICATCTFEKDRVFHHISHNDHSLNLIRREALFDCDACGQKAQDSSYICNHCDFWIHRSCACSTTTISVPNFHHHPMQLVFAIPDMHRSSDQFCGKCKKSVGKNYWSYFCEECSYFVHIRCDASSDTMVRTESSAQENPGQVSASVWDVILKVLDCFSCNISFE